MSGCHPDEKLNICKHNIPSENVINNIFKNIEKIEAEIKILRSSATDSRIHLFDENKKLSKKVDVLISQFQSYIDECDSDDKDESSFIMDMIIDIQKLKKRIEKLESDKENCLPKILWL